MFNLPFPGIHHQVSSYAANLVSEAKFLQIRERLTHVKPRGLRVSLMLGRHLEFS